MNKTIKILLMTTLALTLLTGTIIAQEMSLSLEDAYKTVSKDNISLMIAQKNLENREIEFERSKAENLLKQSNYNEVQAEYNLLGAKKSYIDTANNLLKDTLQKYANILLKEKNIEILDRQVQLNQRLLEEVKAQYNVGEKSQLDILEQQIELNDYIQELEQAKNEYSQLKTELIVQLGINRETPITLVELSEPEYINLSEAEIYEEALKNNLDLELDELNLKLAEIDKKRKEVISSSQMEKEIAVNKVQIAKLQLENQKQEIIDQVRSIFDQLNNLESNIEINKDKIKRANETYNILKEQNKAGLITKNDLMQGEITVLQSEYQLYSSYMNYYIQSLNLNQFLNPEFGVFEYDQK